MFTARRMVPKEFLSVADYAKRLPDGKPCHFAVEAENGKTITGLSWAQAIALAEKLTQDEQVVA